MTTIGGYSITPLSDALVISAPAVPLSVPQTAYSTIGGDSIDPFAGGDVTITMPTDAEYGDHPNTLDDPGPYFTDGYPPADGYDGYHLTDGYQSADVTPLLDMARHSGTCHEPQTGMIFRPRACQVDELCAVGRGLRSRSVATISAPTRLCR